MELAPWLPIGPTRVFADLVAATWEELEQPSAGAYVLSRTDGGVFHYPLANSAVFYVGESGPEKGRLRTHRYHAGRAVADRAKNGAFGRYWLPRYAYAAAFGAEVWWFDTPSGFTSKQLESMLVDCFYWSVGAPPLANGTWPATRYPTLPER